MYAIVKTGGKQYTVRENDVIQIEKLDVPEGGEVVLSDVLFLGNKEQIIGTPIVAGAKVVGKVVTHGLGKKIIGRTYKPKKHSVRRYGHRQPYTQVLIEKISYRKPREKKEEKTTEETAE